MQIFRLLEILGVIACLLARSANRGADINFSGLYWSPCVVILITQIYLFVLKTVTDL